MVAAIDRQSSTDQPQWWPAVRRRAIEFPVTPLEVVAGAIPEGLRGTLYRNGPGQMERSGQLTGHWFDGDGAVLAVRFDRAGDRPRATATYRLVQTAGHRAEEAADRWLFANYGQLAPQPWWQRVGRDLKNAANTSVLPLGDRLLALWEGGWPHALDLDDLTTIGLDSLGGALAKGEAFSAHPKVDPHRGDIYNFCVVPGPKPKLCVFRFDRAGQLQRKRLLPLPSLSLIHDCVLVGPYLVFCVPPIALDLWPALLNFKCFSDALQWQPDRPTKIWLIDRETLELTAEIETEPWFQWHFGNGWQNPDGSIGLTLARYPDFATNQHLKEVASGRITTPAEAKFVEIRLDPQRRRVIEERVLFDRHCDFPTVAPIEVGAPNRYSYLAAHRPGLDDPEVFKREQFSTIARIDAQTDRIDYAELGAGCYPSEPLLVADPAGDGRSGWILSVVYDGNQDRSEVWIWASDRLTEAPIARLALPHPVNLGFHGVWMPG
ncbi:MAG TPA: carotenoid oxygenase family protein [Coleofasciculaceae cyanobacterium]